MKGCGGLTGVLSRTTNVSSFIVYNLTSRPVTFLKKPWLMQ